MLKHLESMDARVASIDRSLAAIAHVFAKLDDSGLLDRLSASHGCSPDCPEPEALPDPQPFEPSPATAFAVTDAEIDAGHWMTRKEAWGRLGIAKSTLEALIDAGELDAYHRKGDERKTKPRVWLKRVDVEAFFRTYTLRKGKEKKPLP